MDETDEEFERLRNLIRDLELEARGRHRRRGQDNQAGGSMSGGDHYVIGFDQSGSHQRRDRSHSRESCQHRERTRSQEYEGRGLDSPEKL